MARTTSGLETIALELLPAAAYICEAPSGLLTRYNRRAAELWGREPRCGDAGERFCGSHALVYADGTPMPRTASPMAEVLRTGRPVADREVGIERPDGSRLTVLANIEPLRDEQGVMVGAVNVLQNVTQYKRPREEAPDSAGFLNTVTDNATVGLLMMDARRHCTFMNPAAERMTGFSLEEVRAQPLHHFVHHTRPDGRPYPRAQCAIDRALPQRQQEQGEEVFVRKDGTFYAVAYTASPIMQDGVPVGTVLELRDISERKRTEAELARLLVREQAARTEAEEERRTIETLHRIGGVLAAELDLQRLLQLLTDEATALTGAQFGAFFYNAVDARGENYMLYTLSGVPREKFERFPMPRNTAVFGPTFRGEGIVRLDDVTRDPRYGRNRPYHGMPAGHLPVRSYLAAPVISRSGKVLGGLFFGHADPGVFTERHERLLAGVAGQAAVAVDNARLYDDAQQAIRLRDEFLSVASHELKTPLTALQLATQSLLRDASRGSAPAAPKLELLFRQIARLGALVDNLLDVSRISAGRIEIGLEQVDLAAVVREVTDRFREEIERARVSVAVQADGPAVGTWDRLRLEQVVSNLLANALKYGAGKPIAVRVCADGGTATLVVQDGGIGIPPEHQSRIFKRFERAVSSRNYGGFGLGLWIVRQIVDALGGRISVVSALGEGSTFTVSLPLGGPSPGAVPDEPSEQAQ